MKTLKLKNYFLTMTANDKEGKTLDFTIQNWLNKQMLHGKVSRARTRFLKLIAPRMQEINEEKQKLIEENAEKNKDKELIYLDAKGKETTDKAKSTQYKMKDAGKFQKDYTNYLQEDFVIDITGATEDTIYGVKTIILDTEEEFKEDMSSIYNEWCEAFENIK